MFKWLKKIQEKNVQADELIEKSHQVNVITLEKAKVRSERTAKQADKQLKKVYDVAKQIHIATGHR